MMVIYLVFPIFFKIIVFIFYRLPEIHNFESCMALGPVRLEDRLGAVRRYCHIQQVSTGQAIFPYIGIFSLRYIVQFYSKQNITDKPEIA